jgi:hypothetical protein
MNWLPHWRFRLLLLSLLLLVVVYPLLRKAFDTRLVFDVLLTVLFVAGILTLFRRPRYRILALLLGLPTLAGIWTHYVLFETMPLSQVIGLHAVAALFLGVCVTAILRDIYQAEVISADSIYGAFCGYLLVGLIYAHLYCIVVSVEPDAFQGNEILVHRLHDRARRHYLLGYFSFITLTTVGYGDLTPVAETAQGLAVLEAITGQFYIAVLLAELLGKRVAQMLSGPRAGPPPAEKGVSTQ